MNNNYKYTIKDVEDTADVVKATVTNPLSGYEFADVDDICSSVITCIFDTVQNVQDKKQFDAYRESLREGSDDDE